MVAQPTDQHKQSSECASLIQKLKLNIDNRAIAALWPDLVDFYRRQQTEIPFLLDMLLEYKNPKVLNAALGSGATTFGLVAAGITNIISNELDDEYKKIALQESERLKIPLKSIIMYDWRELGNYFHNYFDAILCLGNSLTLLFDEKDRLCSIENFKAALSPNGKLIIDERNFTQILNGNFKHSGNSVYCGKDKVLVHPIHISPEIIVMEYEHKARNEKVHVKMYPFKRNELKSLIEQAGLTVECTYGDYKSTFDPKEPEFITYIARKK